MKVHTLSVVIGGYACNFKCPYCVSRMTPKVHKIEAVDNRSSINEGRLRKACRLAQNSGVSTALLTGKGEPTLYPNLISDHIRILNDYFPVVELQTNGLAIYEEDIDSYTLETWANSGLVTVSLSMLHYDPEINYDMKPIRWYDPWAVVDKLHEAGISVRTSCIMAKSYVDSYEDILNFLNSAKQHGVEQTTFRSVSRPDDSATSQAKWVDTFKMTDKQISTLNSKIDAAGTLLLELPHGGRVYDVDGQNVCISTCLTSSTNPEDIRQLIYYPDGHLRYDWKYKGSIIF